MYLCLVFEILHDVLCVLFRSARILERISFSSQAILYKASILITSSYFTFAFTNYLNPFGVNRSVLLCLANIVQLERADVEGRVLFEGVSGRLVLESEGVSVCSSGGEIGGIRDFGGEETRSGVEAAGEGSEGGSGDDESAVHWMICSEVVRGKERRLEAWSLQAVILIVAKPGLNPLVVSRF